MTGYTVHTGTTIKFSESWDRIFQTGAAKSPKKNPASGSVKAKSRVKRAVKKKR